MHSSLSSLSSLSLLSTPRPSTAPRRRVAVVLNGNARAVNDRVVRDLKDILAHDNSALYVSRSLDQGRFIARHIVNKGFDVVLSGGGDGTFCQVVSDVTALGPRRLPTFGVLRLGTGNALATTLGAARANRDGLRRDVERACSGRATGRLSLLRVDGQVAPFAGVGLDALILSDYNATKRSLENTPLRNMAQGGPGYAMAIATRSLWRFAFNSLPEVLIRNDGLPAQRVDIHGRPMGQPVPRGGILYRGAVAIAAASSIPFYGLGLRLFPQVRHDGARFQLRVGKVDATSVLLRLPSLFAGTLNDPRLHDYLCTSITMQVLTPSPLQVGGDEVGPRQQVRIGLQAVEAVQDTTTTAPAVRIPGHAA